MKKKNPFNKSTRKPSLAGKPSPTAKPSLTRIAAPTTQFRAWCDTQSIWISPAWTTEAQADADAQTHAAMGHLVEVKQKIG